MRWNKSTGLKVAVFATGLSGIVAEYILSTLATYFLGDSVFQWTMIVSIMMFSMGIGSRISKLIKQNLLRNFLFIEFALSVAVSFSSMLVYTIASFSEVVGVLIYAMCILVGLFIGMEIPLVIRINDTYESLKTNVSSVMENDYYGSLAGGVFFAFIGLPILGLTYTPFILGIVNFAVAILVFFMIRKECEIKEQRLISVIASFIAVIIVVGISFAQPIMLYGEQRRYKDKVIYEEQSKYQKIVITQWKDDFWLFINGNEQLSSVDEEMYHETLVHPAMKLAQHPQDILILGGGDGCALREVWKYPTVKRVDMVDLDPSMTKLGKDHPILTKMNQNSMQDTRLSIHNKDGYTFLSDSKTFYDVIIIDLPDPKTVELGRLYSYEFYQMCLRHLRKNGTIITQAGSPYYATDAFWCIDKTFKACGLETLPLHNHLITLGEWGWILGMRKDEVSIKSKAKQIQFDNIQTQWINKDAMLHISTFGKVFFSKDTTHIQVNKIDNPTLYRLYLKGNWDLY
ncbi:polyamine aminopropyltransferase [Halosquirtibacter xylanolyticus]|uniref:polyamine aminopropyltransferase n=1 Tax=Halosquirtibacter xylanolyticus TaxID=3374599 RepID=UPI00374A1E98|nr:polyamine aminopropyltransferase [Prolixibacteraceae bacterium]